MFSFSGVRRFELGSLRGILHRADVRLTVFHSGVGLVDRTAGVDGGGILLRRINLAIEGENFQLYRGRFEMSAKKLVCRLDYKAAAGQRKMPTAYAANVTVISYGKPFDR